MFFFVLKFHGKKIVSLLFLFQLFSVYLFKFSANLFIYCGCMSNLTEDNAFKCTLNKQCFANTVKLIHIFTNYDRQHKQTEIIVSKWCEKPKKNYNLLKNKVYCFESNAFLKVLILPIDFPELEFFRFFFLRFFATLVIQFTGFFLHFS